MCNLLGHRVKEFISSTDISYYKFLLVIGCVLHVVILKIFFLKINIDDFDIQLAAASRCLSSRPSNFPRDESTKVFEEGESCVGSTGQQVSCCCCRGQRYGLHAHRRRSRNCPR